MNWIDKIYIISLDSHKRRRETLSMDLHSAGFDINKIEFINAVNGKDLDINQSVMDGIIDDKFLDPFGLLTKSIYGCALSHQLCYQSLLETDDDVKTALILEDDASITHTLLRMLLPNSIGGSRLKEDVDSIDWEVIVMGGQSKKMEFVSDDTDNLLKVMKRYPMQYAGHSYLINKSGAQTLLDTNKCIKYAADVNIHMSNVKLYCTPISYFVQKIGNFEKESVSNLMYTFEKVVTETQDGWKSEDVRSSTTHGDFEQGTQLFNQTCISKSLEIQSVDWESFVHNGDVVEGWTNIHLKL